MEKDFLTGTDSGQGRELPNGGSNSLVDATDSDYDNGYNFDKKEENEPKTMKNKIADTAMKAFEYGKQANSKYNPNPTDFTTQPIENSDTDPGINTEKEIQQKETLIIYEPKRSNMSFDEQVNRLLELGFSIDSEYAGEETYISYFDKDGDAAYSSSPIHKAYLVKGKLAILVEDHPSNSTNKIHKPSEKYNYLDYRKYSSLRPKVDLSDTEKINTLANSSESIEETANKLWNNKEALSDKHSLIDLSKYIPEGETMCIGAGGHTYQANAILGTLCSEHREALDSGEVMIACRDYDWREKAEKKNCYIVSMEEPKALSTVDLIGRYSGTIYQFKDDFYEDTYELYRKHCEDKGLIQPDAQYIKHSSFVRLADPSLKGHFIEVRKGDNKEQKMDYFDEEESDGRWPIRTRASHIAIYQPTLDDFKNIVKKIDEIPDSHSIEQK